MTTLNLAVSGHSLANILRELQYQHEIWILFLLEHVPRSHAELILPLSQLSWIIYLAVITLYLLVFLSQLLAEASQVCLLPSSGFPEPPFNKLQRSLAVISDKCLKFHKIGLNSPSKLSLPLDDLFMLMRGSLSSPMNLTPNLPWHKLDTLYS